MRAYKQGVWDGFRNFFSKKTGAFLTGLLPEICFLLKSQNQQVQFDDQRGPAFQFRFDTITDQFMNQFLPQAPTWEYGSNAGDPILPVTLHDYQVDFLNNIFHHKRGTVYSPTGSGKAQPLDSFVVTPTGFKRMGDIQVGDLVCTPDGGHAPVTGVFPQGMKRVVRVRFSNGDSVECCEDHLWKVNAIHDGWHGKVLTTKTISERVHYPNGVNRYNIDLPKPAAFVKKGLPLDPYLLGVLLGDGSFRQPTGLMLSTIEVEILATVNEMLAPGYKLRRSKSRPCDYFFTSGRRGKGTPPNPYVVAIRSLGLKGKKSKDKFIPQCYLINSPDVRMAVLEGLMDTDGYVCKKGNISYSTTSESLRDSLCWLVHSLGGIASWSKVNKAYTYKGVKKIRSAFNVCFTLPEGVIPFRLGWKRARCKKIRTLRKHRTIANVDFVGMKPCQCIMVDHPDHLYMTDHFVVTHNTMLMVGTILALPPDTPTLILQNRQDLAKQNHDELMAWGIPNVGRLWTKNFKPNTITCACVQSCHRIKEWLPEVKCLIVDEIHEMMSDEPEAVYKALKHCQVRVALSGTPFTFGETDKVQKFKVKGYFGPVFKTSVTESGIITTKELQEQDKLSKSICYFYPVDEPQIPHHIYIDAITDGIAGNIYLHQMVARLIKTLSGRTLILVERLDHGDNLNRMIPGSLWVQGKDDQDTREWVKKQLQRADSCVAIATQQIFNTGLNVFIHNLVNVAGGQADHRIIQRMGRGLRKAKDKEILKYYDFMFRNNPYLEKHSRKRIKILTGQGHEVINKEEIDF